MHILLIHQAFASPHDPGGTRHYELARHLVQAGHHVTVAASQVSYLTGATASGLGAQELQDGIAIRRCRAYPALHRSFLHRLLAYWSFTLSSLFAGARVQRVDLVWGTSPPIFQAVAALVLARLKRVPFLLEIRDLWPDFAIDLGVLRNPLLIALSRWLERLLYRSADQIIVNSPGFLPHLAGLRVPLVKIAEVANGVEVAQFNPDDRADRLRQEWGLDGRFVALYAGAHGMANDLDTILRAAAILQAEPAIAFVLVGDGKEKASLVKRAKEMGLSNVLFLPAQPKERMPQVLAAADVCLATLRPIPMFATTYPNKVFDYMAAGRPTILAIDGVIKRVIEEANGGIFTPPGDARALADAVRSLYKDPSLCRWQGAHARTHVALHFTREVQAQKLVAIVESIGDGRQGSRAYRGKRLLDLAGAVPALFVLLPLMGLIAIFVRLKLGPPVLFRQERPGLGGRPFVLLKFRTMIDARDHGGHPLPDSQRLTPFGRFLRSTSLDELPELINVIRGDMSLVGPRPLLLHYLGRYTPEQMRRHDAKPGITGWAQVNGRNAVSWEAKFAFDLWYVDHCSLAIDLRIIALTMWKILRREGISQPGQATMEEFMGTTRRGTP